MVDGVFHDAHEVYLVRGDERQWVATFATEDLARQYAATNIALGADLEVVPV